MDANKKLSDTEVTAIGNAIRTIIIGAVVILVAVIAAHTYTMSQPVHFTGSVEVSANTGMDPLLEAVLAEMVDDNSTVMLTMNSSAINSSVTVHGEFTVPLALLESDEIKNWG